MTIRPQFFKRSSEGSPFHFYHRTIQSVPLMDEGSQRGLRRLVLINGGGTSTPDYTQEDWESSEESGDEEETHAEVEARTANVEEDQSVCSEDVVGEEAEVMQDLLLMLQRRTMSQGSPVNCVNLEEVFEVRALVMKAVPMFMR